MEDRITTLEKEIEKIRERNRKVEIDKSWETGPIRKVSVAIITYILIGFYMIYLDVKSPWMNAFIPTLGFLISTLTLGWLKSVWAKNRSR